MTRRGTSNSAVRGSSYQRRERKHWLLTTYQAKEGEGLIHCFRCGDLLDWFTLTIDRINPGCEGGTYFRRENLRPSCGDCNSETGGILGAARRLAGAAS
jgi:hypothetical protein